MTHDRQDPPDDRSLSEPKRKTESGRATCLGDLAYMVRSKNAGPFTLTFDIIACDGEAYKSILNSGRLTPAVIAEIYQVSPQRVEVFEIPSIHAIKISIPRLSSAGSPGDLDVYGAQQAAPLMELPV